MRRALHPFDSLTLHHDPNEAEPRRLSSFEIAALALSRKASESSAFGKFQTDMGKRIRHFRYLTSSRDRGSGKNFHQILQHAGALNVFLRESTLEELYKWKLLRVVFRLERKLLAAQRTVDGTLLKHQRSILKELIRHSGTVYDIARRSRPLIDVSSYLDFVHREIVKSAEIIIPYARVKPWQSVFSEMPLESEPQSPEDAIKLRMFSTLKRKLQTAKSQKLGISDSFLDQLTMLVVGREPYLSDAFRKARERHPDTAK
jgi:hypothetical protein